MRKLALFKRMARLDTRARTHTHTHTHTHTTHKLLQTSQEMRKLALFKSVARLGAGTDGARPLDTAELSALREQVRLALAE